MKRFALSLSAFVVASALSLNAADSNLAQVAKDNGLAPLPQNQQEVEAIFKDMNLTFTPFSEEKAELGKKLYFESRLSKSGLISCNTCHNLGMGGTDGVSAAIGHKWTANPSHLNSPTVYNSVLNSVQFWDGRAGTLADQAKGPIEAEPEMATPAKLAVEKIASLPEYKQSFEKIYGKRGLTFDNIADAIATFERTLITPSRFDAFLRGDDKALNAGEKKGLQVFIDKGCTTCHSGINLGGTMQSFGVFSQYKFASVGNFKGDANGLVKVPTLRNVVETAPYFHNGAIWNLKDAIKEMGSIQLGIKISDKEAQQIATFLEALSGQKPQITYPILPASTEKTPKPEL